MGSATLVKYSRMAGEQKLAAHAFEDALPHFERAWRARNPLPIDAEAAAILFGLGCAQAATALRWNRQEGWSNLRRAIDYYLQTGDVGRAVTAATHPSVLPEGASGVSDVIEQVLADVPRGSTQEGWLRARLGAAVYFETADYGRARAAFDRALEIAAAHRDPALELRTLAYETSVDHFDLRWQDVLSKSRRVLKLARRIDDPHSETYARYRAAFVLTHTGRTDEARVEVEANLTAAERLGDHGLLTDALFLASTLAHLRGEWREARAHSDRGLALTPRHLVLLHGRVHLEYETGHEEEGGGYLDRLLEAESFAGPYPLSGVFTAMALSQVAGLSNADDPIRTRPRRRAPYSGATDVGSECCPGCSGQSGALVRFAIRAPAILKPISSSWILSKASPDPVVGSDSACPGRARARGWTATSCDRSIRFGPGVLPAQRVSDRSWPGPVMTTRVCCWRPAIVKIG